MSHPADELISTKEADHLEQDPPIRGQRYACISFVSPSDALACKEVHTAMMYLSSFAKEYNETMDNLKTMFEDNTHVISMLNLLKERHSHLWDPKSMQLDFIAFKNQNGPKIDDDFVQNYGHFKTNINGFKIRGVYDSVEEASRRAQTIKKFDDKFDVFVAEVGCWCPWSPNYDDLKDVEYAESQLNTLMKKYNEQQEARDEIYHNRKDRLVENMKVEKEQMLANARKALESNDAEEARLQYREERLTQLEETAEASEETTEVKEEVTEASEETTEVKEEVTQVSEETTEVKEEVTQASEERTEVSEETIEVKEEVTEASEETAEAKP